MARLTPEQRISRSIRRIALIQADLAALRSEQTIYDYHLLLAEERARQAEEAISALSGHIGEKK